MKTSWGTGIDMTSRTGRTIVIALFTCMALPAWGQQYLLYTPQRLPSGQKRATQEGILVQEIEVQKGDTLYALSRKFGGRGMYFPQILLFNSILSGFLCRKKKRSVQIESTPVRREHLRSPELQETIKRLPRPKQYNPAVNLP